MVDWFITDNQLQLIVSHVEHMKNGKFPMMERMMKMMDERTKGDPSDPTANKRICFNR